jgi:hypothetical protein
MEESNCCGACRLWETDICSYCKEHAEFASLEEWQRKEEVMNYRNSVMDKIIDVWNSFKVIKR